MTHTCLLEYKHNTGTKRKHMGVIIGNNTRSGVSLEGKKKDNELKAAVRAQGRGKCRSSCRERRMLGAFLRRLHEKGE